MGEGWSGRVSDNWKSIHAHVFICPTSLCLLVVAFNPFTFRVIIDIPGTAEPGGLPSMGSHRVRHDWSNLAWSYYSFLNCFGFILCRFFPSLCILPREVPLAFVVKLVWWCWILLTFACLESFWFLQQIWARVSFRFDGEIKSFTDKQKLKEFSTTKPALQQMLKELL